MNTSIYIIIFVDRIREKDQYMKICIIGHTGFVGQTVYNYLSTIYHTCGINTKTTKIPKDHFDITINCAGNAKKYLSEKEPQKDILINAKIFNTILQLKTKKLIHISSISATDLPNNNYTISKLITEEYSKLYFSNSIILRLGGIIGPNLKKNVVFDIINNKKLFVTFNSTYNYISTNAIAKIIEKIIKLNIQNKIINIAACDSISVSEIITEAKKKNILFNKTEGDIKEKYTNIDVTNLKDFFIPENSKYYIKEFLKSIQK